MGCAFKNAEITLPLFYIFDLLVNKTNFHNFQLFRGKIVQKLEKMFARFHQKKSLFLLVKQGFTAEERQKFRENVVDKCKESTKATEEDFANLKAHEIPTTQTAKCLAACIKEKLGVVRNISILILIEVLKYKL